MESCNIHATTIINTIGILYSTTIIIQAIGSLQYGHYACEDQFPGFELGRGIWILILSLMGLIIAKCQNKILEAIYLTLLCMMLVAVLCLMGILAFGTENDDVEGGNSENQYCLESYSMWLRMRVVNEEEMIRFKNCMVEKDVCKKHLYNEDTWEHPIEVGCCNPPASCGYVKKNKTTWVMPQTGIASYDIDCLNWVGNGYSFCLDCDSCKAAVLLCFYTIGTLETLSASSMLLFFLDAFLSNFITQRELRVLNILEYGPVARTHGHADTAIYKTPFCSYFYYCPVT